MTRRTWIGAAIVAVVAIAAACSDGNDSHTDAGGSLASAAPATTAGLDDGLSGYDRTTLGWNGYWYSRYNLGTLAMKSGLGVTFMPPAGAMAQMMAMADANPGAGEDVPMVKNPALLAAVFASADSHFASPNNGDAMDLANGRFDPSTFDTTITPAAQGMLMTKEAEWAKLFLFAPWAGTIEDDFGAFDRFKGLVLFTEAKMQAKFALEHLRDSDGLFVPARSVDGEIVPTGEPAAPYDQYVMVMALSDVLTVLNAPEQWQNVYRDDQTRAMLQQALGDVYSKVSDSLRPETVHGLAWAARSDVWFAAATADPALRQRALENLRRHGDALLALTAADPVAHARRIRGLVEAGRVLEDGRYIEAAAGDFAALRTAFDPRTGGLAGVETLRADEVADIVGALNALDQFGGSAMEAGEAGALLVPFYEAVVNMGGMQQTAPPKEMAASPFELERLGGNDLLFAYPAIQTPAAAGGVAPVIAHAVRFDGRRWSVSDTRFDSHAAMYLSNEELWTFGMVSGFQNIARDAASDLTGFPEVASRLITAD